MKPTEPHKTFVVQFSQLDFRPVVIALALFLVFWLGLEGIARLEGVRAALPPGSIGMETEGGEIDLKVALLDAYNRQAPVNCIILGDSMVDYGADPQILQDEIQQVSGKNYRCFNFGLRCMMAQTSATMAQILTERYHPELILYGTNPTDYLGYVYRLRGLNKLPWVQYQLGNPSLEGWLVEHLMIYRYLLVLPKTQLSAYHASMRAFEARYANGFQAQTAAVDVPEIPRKPYETYSLNPTDVDGLKRMAGLNQGKTRVVVFEMPFHQNNYPNYIVGGVGAFERDYLQPVTAALGELGLQYIQSYPALPPQIPEDSWMDNIHMNQKGAAFFSRWLGGQVGEVLGR